MLEIKDPLKETNSTQTWLEWIIDHLEVLKGKVPQMGPQTGLVCGDKKMWLSIGIPASLTFSGYLGSL